MGIEREKENGAGEISESKGTMYPFDKIETVRSASGNRVGNRRPLKKLLFNGIFCRRRKME